MGFFFTLLYLIIAYVTPLELFGSLADFHVELIIVSLAVLCSLPNLFSSNVLTSRQAFAVLAFSSAIFLSVALTGWFGGAISAFYGFLQTELAFFLVAINCKRRVHLQIIVMALILSSTFFILLGMRDLAAQVIPSPFLFGEGSLRRIRGLGFVNDPNDFAQAMVSLIPAIFLWKRPGLLANMFLMGLPLAVLLVGLYLTHSRGAIVALAAVVLISARRKIGTIPAALLAGLLFAGGLAVGWSGGRDVSMDAGADRLDLWAAGLDMIKAHPFFGVGIGGFADANGITAHNSVVICAAETGVVGLFFWTMLLVISFRDSLRYDLTNERVPPANKDDDDVTLSQPVLLSRGERGNNSFLMQRDTVTTKQYLRHQSRPSSATQSQIRTFIRYIGDKGSKGIFILPKGQSTNGGLRAFPELKPNAMEVRNVIRVLTASLTGFLTAGWFLSRAISMWLFMYCGMLYAVHQMGAEAGIVPAKEGFGPTLRWSLVVTLVLIILISGILRLRNFAH